MHGGQRGAGRVLGRLLTKLLVRGDGDSHESKSSREYWPDSGHIFFFFSGHILNQGHLPLQGSPEHLFPHCLFFWFFHFCESPFFFPIELSVSCPLICRNSLYMLATNSLLSCRYFFPVVTLFSYFGGITFVHRI